MAAGIIPPGTKKVFYGWFVLVGVIFVVFIAGGTFVNSFGVLLPIITVEFGWSRAVVAGALSAGILAFGLPSLFYGILVARLGPRFTIISGNLLAVLGIAGVYLTQEVWNIYILYIIAGLGAGMGGYIPATTLINNWFNKKRSLALGIFAACVGLGGLTFPPLTTALIDVMGWRLTWLALAGLILVFSVLIGGVVMVRNRPEDMGLTPDGMPADSYVGISAEELPPADGDEVAWRITRVLRGSTAWLIGGFAFANAFTMGTMVTHQIAYLQDIGFNAMTAATTLSFMSVFGIMGSLVFGWLALRFNLRHLAMAAFSVQILGLIVLLTTRELTLIYVYAAFQGLSNGSLVAALPTFVGNYYPRNHYARVIGVVFPFQVVANALAATIAGAIFDVSGTYMPAFATAAFFSLAGLVFVSMVRRPKPV
jgi:MFS family permease